MLDLWTETSAAAETDVLLDARSREYERLSELARRLGAWLLSAPARELPATEWEARFEEYREQLRRLQRLGDELRPASLRERHDALEGPDLVDEVRELFAA